MASLLQNGQDVPVGLDDEGDLAEPRPAAAAAAPSVEDRILDRLLERLGRMGVTSPGGSAQPQPEPWVASPGGAQPLPEEQWEEQHSHHSGQQWNTQSADQQWGQSGDDWQAWPGTSSGWASWQNWKTTGWSDNSDKFDRPYISHLDFPKFDGRREEYSNYQYAVMNLKSQCAPRDYKYLAPKLISNFTGAMSEDARAMELLGSDYQVDDGVDQLLAFIRKRLHITDLNLETEAFEKYFTHLVRKKGETLMKYINAEETAYRKLQRVLKSATDGGQDEYSSDDGSTNRKFQLPKRLRG